MTGQEFATQDVLSLEVEVPPTGLRNLIKNPSGEKGGWFWITPVAGSTMSGSTAPLSGVEGQKLVYATAAGANYFYTENVSVVPGQYVAASWEAPFAQDYYRVKIEFLLSDGVTVTGSSAQTGYLQGSVDTKYVSTTLVPTGAIYARLRFDYYANTSGGSTVAGHYMLLRKATLATAATVGALGTSRINFIPNPSFESSTTGWNVLRAGIDATPSMTRSTAQAYAGTTSLAITASSSGNTLMGAAMASVVQVTPGLSYTAQVWTRAASVARNTRIAIEWYSGTTYLATSITSDVLNSTAGWTRTSKTATAPSNADKALVYVAIEGAIPASEVHYFDAVMLEQSSTVGTYFDGNTPDAAGFDYSWSGAANNSVSNAATANLEYIGPYTWRNILGGTHEIKIDREELTPGTLQATILDSTLDPAVADYIRPGRKIRLRAQRPGTRTETYVVTPEVWSSTLEKTNLVKNPSFEVNTSNWSSRSNCTLARVTTPSQIGSASLRIQASSAATMQVQTDVGTAGAPVVVGTTYYAMTYVRAATTGRATSIGVAWYTSGGALIGTPTFSGAVTTSNGGWSFVSGNFTAPATAAFATVIVQVTSPALSEQHYIDTVMLMVTGVPSSYFDGDTTDTPFLQYDWTGTAHASTSTRTKYFISSEAVTDTRQVPYEAENIFEGTITTGQVSYAPKTRIELTAVDAVKELSNKPVSTTVATIAELPYILEGAGVPWIINGSSDQVSSATKTSNNENASLLDQITTTRDSTNGYAWVDKDNVLQAWDNTKVSTPNFIDTFDVIDTTVWTPTDALVTATGGKAVIRLDPAEWYGELFSKGTFNLYNGTLAIKQELTVPFTSSDNQYIQISIAGIVILYIDRFGWDFYSYRNSAVEYAAGVVATPPTDPWIRFRVESANPVSTVYLDTSPDGVTWTNLNKIRTSADMSSARVNIALNDWTGVHAVEYSVDEIRTQTAGVLVLDESVYSDIDVSFNTDECINAVRVNYLRYTSGTDTSEEIAYGPYVDVVSVNNWGYHAADFVYTKTPESAPGIAAFANAILAANKDPEIMIREMTLPVTKASHITDHAVLDLYDGVTASYAPVGRTYGKVTGISHEITPNKWIMDIKFGADTFVRRPYRIPSPGKGA